MIYKLISSIIVKLALTSSSKVSAGFSYQPDTPACLKKD